MHISSFSVPSSRTLKQGCKAGIKVTLSDDCQYLEVVDVNESHNQDMSKVLLIVVFPTVPFFVKAIYEHLPRQRKLTSPQKIEAIGLLKLKVNRKLLQQHLSESSGKVVTLKDISNISTGVKKVSVESIEGLVTKLKGIKGKL